MHRTKAILPTLAFFCCFVSPSFGQQYSARLSASDSLTLKRYVDTVNNSSVYSHKRQRYLDSILLIDHTNAYWWQQKGMPLAKVKKYEVAMDFLDSAVKYDLHKYIDYRAFMKCIFQKSYRGAITDFHASKAIIGAGSVMDHSYDFYIGLSYLMLNQLDSAEFYLDKTTTEQRKTLGDHWVHPVDWFYLGLVYYEQEQYAKAAEIFDNSLKLYTNFSDVKYYKAICLKKLNKDEEALALMKEAGNDFKAGFTINEDNVVYEAYPYQVVKQSRYDEFVKFLEHKAE